MTSGIAFQSLRTRDVLYDVAHHMIATHIQTVINAGSGPSLFLSGGSTPGPVYTRLSDTDLPWEQVTIGQVDERWVDRPDPGSNAGLIERTLLQGQARAAHFVPMKTPDMTAAIGQTHLNKIYDGLITPHSQAVLGMGTDGHIAAWFSGAEGYPSALDVKTHKTVQAIMAPKAEVTGDYLERITLTLRALLRCQSLLLLITGDEKKRVMKRAMDDTDTRLPISHLLRAVRAQDKAPRLTILYAD